MLKDKLLLLINIKSYIELYKYSKNYRLNIFLIGISNVFLAIINVFIAIVSKYLIDAAIDGNISASLKFGAYLGSIFLLDLIISSAVMFITARIRAAMKKELQLDILSKIYNKQWLLLSNYKTGDLLTRITSDISNVVEVWIAYFPELISMLIQLFTAFIVLFFFDPTLAILAFFIGPFTIIISFLIGTKLKFYQQKIQKSESNISSFITESIQNIIILKAFKYIDTNLKKTEKYQTEKYDLILKQTKVSVASSFIMEIGFSLSYFGSIAFGAYRLVYQAISFGTFTAFLQLIAQIQNPMAMLARKLQKIVKSLASVERLMEIDSLTDEAYISGINHRDTLLPTSIDFKSVFFSYDNNQPILKNVTFSIPVGKKIAIIGHSGKGKTTLIRLLLSLITPQQGQLVMNFDNNTYLDFSTNTRKFFSYVPQKNNLFSGSIIDNLLIAKPSATDEEIALALKISCIDEFVYSLPNGLQTIIGERGIGLSEGQGQRISIARALLHNAPFLILDESTSALDNKTENRIIDFLNLYYPTKTIIAITHRKSILSICDETYEVSDYSLHKKAK